MTESETRYFSDMYEKYSKAVYGVCLMYLKNKDDAEEAVSESFVRLMENKPEFESESHAKAYLMRAAVNICKNCLNSGWRKKVQNDDVLMYMTSPEEETIMNEVLSLPPKYRVIIYMHYYAGYSTKEIAEIMNISQSAVLSRLSRGRNKLKAILTEGGFHYAT